MAGVGGRTIAEAKQRLSYAEVMSWQAYMRKRGPLCEQRRRDWSFALLAMLLDRQSGGRNEMIDFMPYDSDQDREIGLEEALERWQ